MLSPIEVATARVCAAFKLKRKLTSLFSLGELNIVFHREGLEELFPSCTVAWDLNSRIQYEWKGHHLRIGFEDSNLTLTAFRETEFGQNVTFKIPKKYYLEDGLACWTLENRIEKALYATAAERWVVIR